MAKVINTLAYFQYVPLIDFIFRDYRLKVHLLWFWNAWCAWYCYCDQVDLML